MKTVVIVALLLLSLFTVGCATTKSDLDPNYVAYLNTVQAANSTQKQEIQLFKLEGVDGQQIELKGVKSITVNMPAQNTANANSIKGYQAPRNEWVDVVNTAIKVGGGIAGYYVIGNVVTDVVESIGKNAGHNTTGSFNDSSSGNYRGNAGSVTHDQSVGDYRNNGSLTHDQSAGDNRGNTNTNSFNDQSAGDYRNNGTVGHDQSAGDQRNNNGSSWNNPISNPNPQDYIVTPVVPNVPVVVTNPTP